MSLLRRNREAAESSDATEIDQLDVTSQKSDGDPPTTCVDSNIERTITDLTDNIGRCVSRLETIEVRLGELADTVSNAPSHSDVLEVRLHSAKLAAELARATVELRGEIGMASEEARRAARLARNTEPATGEVPVVLPVDVDLADVAPAENNKPASRYSESA